MSNFLSGKDFCGWGSRMTLKILRWVILSITNNQNTRMRGSEINFQSDE